jgi:hypothetical protein
MALYRVYEVQPDLAKSLSRRGAAVTVVVFVALLAVPLSVSSEQIATESIRRSDVAAVAKAWAASRGWSVESVETTHDGIEVKATGPLPSPDPTRLRRELDTARLSSVDVVLELVPSERVELDGS